MKRIVNEVIDIYIEVPTLFDMLRSINTDDIKKLTSPYIGVYDGLFNMHNTESRLYSIIRIWVDRSEMYVRFENRTSKNTEYILNEIWEDYCHYLNGILGEGYEEQVEEIRKLWY